MPQQGIDRQKYLENETITRGKLAQRLWDTGESTLGLEYGYLMGLVGVFNLAKEDLCKM